MIGTFSFRSSGVWSKTHLAGRNHLPTMTARGMYTTHFTLVCPRAALQQATTQNLDKMLQEKLEKAGRRYDRRRSSLLTISNLGS